MNTYSKFCPNVFLAKCTEKHQKGDIINVTTKYGKENESEVYNLVYTKDGFFFYSIVRADGFNIQERAKAKAERLKSWAISANKKSDQYYEASKEGRDFLALGEPIKIGHHSERRHRNLIERNHQRMGKSIEFSEKAEAHESKAEYWERKSKDINLSMPESLEYYEYKLEEAKKEHQILKDDPSKRSHSFSLTYAKKAVNEAEKNLELAVKLWGDEDSIKLIADEKKEKEEVKLKKQKSKNDIIANLGGFFAFNTDQFKEGYEKIKKDGLIEEGEKVTHFGHGLYIPSKNVEEFKRKY